MSDLCIIPCGTKKIWDKKGNIGPIIAKDAYIGTFHKLCEQYAECFFNDWIILSAKHGFLFPTDLVPGNYDVTFNMKSEDIITMDELKNQVEEKELNRFNNIVVLTGKKYMPIVNGCFLKEEVTIQFPLITYSGIGFMQQALKSSVNRNVPLHKV